MTGRRSSEAQALGWLPRVQAIERCFHDGSRCDYLAWLVVLPDRTAITGALGGTARDITLWPSVDDALAAFGPGTVVDDSPVRHMTPDEAVRAAAGPAPVALPANDPQVVLPDGPVQLNSRRRGRRASGGGCVVVQLPSGAEQPTVPRPDGVEGTDWGRG